MIKTSLCSSKLIYFIIVLAMAPTKQNAEEVVDVAAALAADEGDKCLYLFKASVFDGNTTYVS